MNQLTLLPLPLLRFSYSANLVSGSLTYCRINIFSSFSFAISTWSPAHGILTIFTIIGNVSNLQREITCLPFAYNLRFPHRIYPVDKSTLYSRSVNCMCSWTLWVLAGLVITPPLPSPNANLAARQKGNILAIPPKQPGSGGVVGLDSMQNSSVQTLEDLVPNHLYSPLQQESHLLKLSPGLSPGPPWRSPSLEINFFNLD